MHRLLSLAAIAGVVAGLLWGAPSAGAVTVSGQQTSSITWGSCSDPNLQAVNAQCGYLSVPLDYGNPGAGTVRLAVSRIAHTSSIYQGIILTNPGGPGGSGLGLNPFVIAQLQADGYGSTVAQYDWIGFDPRGVGSSVPAISCDPNYFGPNRPSYIPFTRQLLNTWLSRSASYAQACGSQNALQTALLQHMTTVDTVKDMDSIRQALGQEQMTYYGFSYGTYLGQVYSTLFPSRVRRLILDSNVDPRTVWYRQTLNRDVGFDRNLNIWFAWLAKYNDVFHLGATQRAVQRTFYLAEARLAFHPAGGVVGPDEWTDVVVIAAYSQAVWVPGGQVFSDWVNHHDAAAADELIGLYQAVDGPGNDNGSAVYLGVVCTDAPWPTDWSVWSRDNWTVFSDAPISTWRNAWGSAPCIYWPAPPSQPVAVDGSGIPSALLIDETLDAATPFQGSLEVRRLFPNAVLLAEPGGTSHAETPSGDLCVDGTIAAYLDTGALPARDNDASWDKTCPPPPTPVPPQAASGVKSAVRALKPSIRERLRLGLPAVEFR